MCGGGGGGKGGGGRIKLSKQGVNQRSDDITRTQQQRPESVQVTQTPPEVHRTDTNNGAPLLVACVSGYRER